MISYKNLWKRLIDRDLKKTDLLYLAGISSATLAKMGRGEAVSFDTIEKLCNVLDCGISDILTIEKVISAPEEASIIKGKAVEMSTEDGSVDADTSKNKIIVMA